MAISTYSELQTAVANWLDRSDLTSRIPEFISIAESRINRMMRVEEQGKRTTLTTTSGNAYVSLPTDFREIRGLTLDDDRDDRLTFISLERLDDEYSASGRPAFYGVIGGELKLGPVPDAAYTLNLYYIADLAVLSDSNTSNDVLTAHPDVYLYGALQAAYEYLQEEERATFYERRFVNVMGELNDDRDGGRFAQSLRLQSDYGEVTYP